MNLQDEVKTLFAPGGVLAQTTDHFAARTGQVQMAVAVAQAIENPKALVVEASTGVGKTFSYLVPALLSGERVLVSTATKALQDQLFGRDTQAGERTGRFGEHCLAKRTRKLPLPASFGAGTP